MRRVTKWYLALLVLVMLSGLAAWLFGSMQESRPSNAQLVFAEPIVTLAREAADGTKAEKDAALIGEWIGGPAR